MNLIEQLGGYHNSKCYLESCGDMDSIGGFTPLQIQEALLQYRREHNIFDVGDKVVYLKNIAPEHNDIYEVWKTDRIGCLIMLGDMDYRAIYSQIKHAEPEEIQAGRRLEVCGG